MLQPRDSRVRATNVNTRYATSRRTQHCSWLRSRFASDIFEAVQSSSVTHGIVPFENSTNGPVVYTLDLFADRDVSFPDVFVCGEAYLSVHHYLLGHISDATSSASSKPDIPTPQISSPSLSTSPTEPPTSLNHIQRLYSHPHAFGQCEIFLSKFLKTVERYDVSSTSKAAELVASDGLFSAAIASKVAARVHNLDILARRIEDRDDNTTRFFVLKKGTDNKSDPERKHLLSFTVEHLSPGALAEALMVFKAHGLNLTSINSRPSGELPWHYIFFVEFNGPRGGVGSVEEALEDLAKIAKGWRWLGSWKDQSKR